MSLYFESCGYLKGQHFYSDPRYLRLQIIPRIYQDKLTTVLKFNGGVGSTRCASHSAEAETLKGGPSRPPLALYLPTIKTNRLPSQLHIKEKDARLIHEKCFPRPFLSWVFGWSQYGLEGVGPQNTRLFTERRRLSPSMPQ